jgi:cell wall-associated NlpC family hydrolase
MVKVKYFLLFLLLSTACGSIQRSESKIDSAERKALLDKYSRLVGESISPKELPLYRFVDVWWGVPYRYGGTTRVGVDCSAFVQQLYREVYRKEVARSTTELYKQARKIPKRKLKMGDLVFFDLTGSKKITHVGVYLQNGRFAHASTKKGVRIDYLGDPYYRKQKYIAARLP